MEYVKVDEYLKDRKHFKEMEDMGFEVEPVDMNGAYVPLDKNSSDNLQEVQQTTRDRFGLGGENIEVPLTPIPLGIRKIRIGM